MSNSGAGDRNVGAAAPPLRGSSTYVTGVLDREHTMTIRAELRRELAPTRGASEPREATIYYSRSDGDRWWWDRVDVYDADAHTETYHRSDGDVPEWASAVAEDYIPPQ